MAKSFPSQLDRLNEFLARLNAATPARSFDEAFGQVFRLLNEVEDELSGLPFEPLENPRGGRLYPPLWDNIRRNAPVFGVWRLRAARHVIFIGDNGAIALYTFPEEILLFEKAGVDGRIVNQL